MDEKNPVRVLVDSGSKGNKLNIVQMMGSIGQQDYEGGRMPKNYNNRFNVFKNLYNINCVFICHSIH